MTTQLPIHGVVVLYRPPEDIIAFLNAMEVAGIPMIAVYNEADPQQVALWRTQCSSEFLPFDSNVGLAAALNAGIDRARKRGAIFVALFDQDSRPSAALPFQLQQVLEAARSAGLRPAVAGPIHLDVKSHRSPSPHDAAAAPFVERATVITSGSLIPIEVLDDVGPMWNELFIDDIDHEWCLRARHLGYHVVQATDVYMSHDLGDVGLNFLGKFKPLHRSPFRHYHIVRNTLAMLKIAAAPLAWRMSEAAKTLYRMPIYLLASSDRKATFLALLRAFGDYRALLRSLPAKWRQ